MLKMFDIPDGFLINGALLNMAGVDELLTFFNLIKLQSFEGKKTSFSEAR